MDSESVYVVGIGMLRGEWQCAHVQSLELAVVLLLSFLPPFLAICFLLYHSKILFQIVVIVPRPSFVTIRSLCLYCTVSRFRSWSHVFNLKIAVRAPKLSSCQFFGIGSSSAWALVCSFAAQTPNRHRLNHFHFDCAIVMSLEKTKFLFLYFTRIYLDHPAVNMPCRISIPSICFFGRSFCI